MLYERLCGLVIILIEKEILAELEYKKLFSNSAYQ